MATIKHPASLNALQQYKQACSILRNTSRATNSAWYQEALDLDYQLHIRPDGADICSFYFDRKSGQWSLGPSFTDESLHDPAKVDSLAAEVLLHAKSVKAKSLGVVLHIADEFATTELKPELDNPAALPELRGTAVSDPKEILEDASIRIDQASWRVIPYPANGNEAIGTAVTVTRQYTELLAAFRKTGEAENFPIITQALSAPLVAIMGLRFILKPSTEKPFVTILQYSWFTVMAFFNEHADLCLVRTLQHRGVRRPTNLRTALTTSNASLEFVDPDLYLLELGKGVDTMLAPTLRAAFPLSEVEVLQPPCNDSIPPWCPEPVISNLPSDTPYTISSHTFSVLVDEKWATQDFLPTPKEVEEVYPTLSEMRLLRGLRFARFVVAAIVILSIAFLALGMLNTVRRPEWSFDPSQAENIKGRLAKMTNERKKADHWNNLLEDRSKSWSTMESLSRLFPENGGILVKNFSYSAKPDSAAGQAKVGFVKEWKIKGYARDGALDHLNTLNTREGVSAHFTEIARITGNSAFDPSTGNRSISVNVRTQENSTFKPLPPEQSSDADESSYPFTFDLTITQRFEATDPMAITVSKIP